MKRSKDKVEKEIEYQEGAEFFGNETRIAGTPKEAQYIIEHSMVPIEKLVNGRMSFKGMNPEIERLMEQEWHNIREQQKALEREISNRPEISDKAMAKRLGKTVSKKYGDRKVACNSDDSEEENINSDDSDKSPPKRGKFLKPKDD